MLILNIMNVKHSEYTPLSAFHLNSNTNYSQWPSLEKVGNYQQIFQ